MGQRQLTLKNTTQKVTKNEGRLLEEGVTRGHFLSPRVLLSLLSMLLQVRRLTGA
ncbi:hypothetical protein SAMD00079811_09330 [Scytonema sp. HK-05]|nr:hypothetical protein SAMD00079811_09330 [Scytonema sp. HK-05]